VKQLCYIVNNFAYFTDKFDKVRGDDWNDAPYEHNAGSPYAEFNITVISFFGDFCTPDEGVCNSVYSVDDINNKKVAWLRKTDWTKEKNLETNLFPMFELFAGATIEEFRTFIFEHGGRIFEEVKK